MQKKERKKERKNSFTLVELLIVIVIIGILATMAVPQYNKMVEKAKWTECVSILGQIRNVCKLYYAEYSMWPNDKDGYEKYINGASKDTKPVPAAFKNYIDVPEPKNGRYVYSLFSFQDMTHGLACGFYDFDTDGERDIGIPNDEGYILIKEDGTLANHPPAPKF